MNNSIDQILEQSHQRVNLRTFYERFVASLCHSTDAHAAIVWSCDQQRVTPIYEFLSDPETPLNLPFSEKENLNLIRKAIEEKKPVVATAKNPAPGGEALPGIVAGPVFRNGHTELVQLFTRPIDSQEAVNANLKTISHYCQIASQFRAAADEVTDSVDPAMPPAAPSAISSEILDQYVERLHRDIDQRETNLRICNETRRVLKCDRVSVAQKKRGGFEVVAISGQPTVNKRSNVVQLLRKLGRRVLPTGQPFWYPGAEDLPPQIEGPLNQYLAQSTTRTMAIIPLMDQPPPDEEETTHHKHPDPSVIGGLIIEHFSQQWQRERVAATVDTVCRHAGTAFRNSFNHRKLFLYPLWYWIGKSKILFTARHLPKTLAALIGLLVLAIALVFVPYPFNVHCEGTLVPIERRNVFSQIDGKVAEIYENVGHGHRVSEGQKLVRLTSEEHEMRVQSATSRLQQLLLQKEAIEDRQLDPIDPNPERPSAQPVGEAYQPLLAEIESARRELKILQEISKDMIVFSPISGENITWNFRKKLKDRPIQRGEFLCEIANVDGEWELQMNLPDRRIGHVLKQRHETEGDLTVEFSPAAAPNRTYSGTVTEIGLATDVDPEKGQTIRVRVAIEEDDLDFLQANSGISAKIRCGYRSMGYVWLHDVGDWIQKHVIFRLW